MSERYIVASVEGYTINPESTRGFGGSRRKPTRSFAVLDSAVCYSIVEEFITNSSSFGEKHNEQLAEALAARLNAEDAS
jgi:hypothetical protein